MAYTVYEVNEKIVDEINILQATRLGMKNALESLKIVPDTVITDGNMTLDIPFPQRSHRARRRAFLFYRGGKYRRKSIQGRTHGKICKDVSRIRL